MIRNFHSKAKIGECTNTTFLSLIPKDTNPNSFSRFRPISLCNSSYKIISKMLGTRLKPLLNKIISGNQGDFLKGRQILDNVILVQEAIHSNRIRKEKGMIIKLDMANAFDRVKHSFLFKIMNRFGFNDTFIRWISECISKPWIAPLINSCPTDFFQASRGISQGCPLSSFLYIIIAESLSRKLNSDLNSGSIPGLCFSQDSHPLNHTLFADDSLFLGGTSSTIARKFNHNLTLYCSASGGKINLHKSAIYCWNTTNNTAARISRILNIKVHNIWNKFNYLGLPITLGN